MSEALFWHFINAFRRNLNPTRIVVLSFGAIILTGALLLTLPLASRSGQSAGLLTALFTATSATCVTGLVLVDTWLSWTTFGQFVILLMIQMGGLGFMTVITLFSFALHRRIGLSERLIMVSTLNLNDMDGVVRVVRHALMGTFLMELAGAVIFCTRFIPQFGPVRGIWMSIFHSISAFCNAGFDLMGGRTPFASFTGYTGDPVILFTAMILIVVGGIGFFVWEDILRSRSFKRLSFYSKMVLSITGILIASGTLFIFFVEYGNTSTLGGMNFWEKILNSMFQSVTLRTAGFNTLDQGALRESSLVISILFMLVGGSSGSTAGGIKTATLGVLMLAVRAGFLGREDIAFHGRTISTRRVMNAMTLTIVVSFVFIGSSMLIALVDGIPFLKVAFEVASAMGTVGLSTGITPTLSTFARLIIIGLMFLGRVGILSFSLAFITNGRRSGKITYPTCEIMIG